MKSKIHPYKDKEYIFFLLISNKLLTPDQKNEIELGLRAKDKKLDDFVQYLASIKIPRAGKKNRFLEEADILKLIALDQGWQFRRLDPLKLDMDTVTNTIPASFAKRVLVVPIKAMEGVVEVGCYDPLITDLFEDIERATKKKVRFYVCPKKDIERIISEFFGFKKSIAAAENLLKGPSFDLGNLEQMVQLATADSIHSDRYIQQAVDHLLQYALEQRASDIHLEPKREFSIVRFRIDGQLHQIHRIPRVVHEAICSRIKALSRLDIAEKRRPQDGRMKISWKDEEAEVRVSSVPVAFGEKLVLRLQSAQIIFKDLSELGFHETDLKKYEAFLEKSYGIVLVTGPTGSGKSTTLYSTLRRLSKPSINIVTVEDPIEMVHEDFNQIAVQPSIGITFASILRNILRQDPDVIMIGEIRDIETARYAIQAALTGHLVFSTLHTNDAVSAITRLLDIGIEPYLISSTLIGVVAQRLVRRICPRCKEKVKVEKQRLSLLDCKVKTDKDYIMLSKGRGCDFCRQTGFYGRIAIYEILAVDETIKSMIYEGAPEISIKKTAKRLGMTTLRQDACRKLIAGITSLDEVLRVTCSN